MHEIEEALRKMIARIAETNEDFSLDADLRNELDLDSHRAVELLFEVEQVFHVTVPDDKFDQLQTLRKAIALVSSLQGAAR